MLCSPAMPTKNKRGKHEKLSLNFELAKYLLKCWISVRSGVRYARSKSFLNKQFQNSGENRRKLTYIMWRTLKCGFTIGFYLNIQELRALQALQGMNFWETFIEIAICLHFTDLWEQCKQNFLQTFRIEWKGAWKYLKSFLVLKWNGFWPNTQIKK